jgi:hypothetical protein
MKPSRLAPQYAEHLITVAHTTMLPRVRLGLATANMLNFNGKRKQESEPEGRQPPSIERLDTSRVELHSTIAWHFRLDLAVGRRDHGIIQRSHVQVLALCRQGDQKSFILDGERLINAPPDHGFSSWPKR